MLENYYVTALVSQVIQIRGKDQGRVLFYFFSDTIKTTKKFFFFFLEKFTISKMCFNWFWKISFGKLHYFLLIQIERKTEVEK